MTYTSNPTATTTNLDRPARSRSLLVHWAEAHGVERCNLQRLFTAVSGWVRGAPLLIPGLNPQTFYDPGRFAWTHDLIGLASALRAELATLSSDLVPHPESATLVERGGWRACFLWRSSREMGLHPTNAATAVSAVRLAPGGGQAGNAYYSVIDPGTSIRRHTGPFNGRLRCHLGLDVPDRCHIEIGGEYRTWRNDECLVFSDLPPHSVVNESEKARSVYVLDFWHPELGEDERNALATLLACRL
jgi:hypothetical protein